MLYSGVWDRTILVYMRLVCWIYFLKDDMLYEIYMFIFKFIRAIGDVLAYVYLF